MAKEKNIIFSEEIDSMINGIAIGLAFLMFSFLIFHFNIFHTIIIDRFISVISAVLGILFTSFEIDKIDKNKVYGVGDFVLGLIFMLPAIGVILYFNKVYLNILMSLPFVFGAYGSCRGLIEIIYSVGKRDKSENKKLDIVKIITFFTEFIGLIIVVIQLIAEIIKNK